MRLNDHKNPTVSVRRARDLRNSATPYERKLWAILSENSKLKGLRFRRQQPIHPYIVDFACMKAQLVIEIDGYSHDVRQEYDKAREEKLKQMGFVILRFTNEDVKTNVDGVVETILNHAERLVIHNRDVAPAALPPP